MNSTLVFEPDDIIEDRYKIDFLLEQSLNAMYYVVTDISTKSEKTQCILKVRDSQQELQKEIGQIRKDLLLIEQSIKLTKSSIINKKMVEMEKKSNEPNFFIPDICYDGRSNYCIIKMEKYLLPNYLERYKTGKKQLKYIDAILQVAQQILLNLEQIHEAGFSYNYLQLNCIMVTENGRVVFNDFSYLQRLDVKQNNTNIQQQKNYMFGSVNHLLNVASRRKDDIVQLFNLMIYLLCDQQFLGHDGFVMNLEPKKNDHGQSQEFLLKDILKYRYKYDLQDLTILLVDVIQLFPKEFNALKASLNEKIQQQEEKFFNYFQEIALTIESKSYDETPNYSRLYELFSGCRKTLRKINYTISECQNYKDSLMKSAIVEQEKSKKEYKLTTLRRYQMAVRLNFNEQE